MFFERLFGEMIGQQGGRSQGQRDQRERESGEPQPKSHTSPFGYRGGAHGSPDLVPDLEKILQGAHLFAGELSSQARELDSLFDSRRKLFLELGEPDVLYLRLLARLLFEDRLTRKDSLSQFVLQGILNHTGGRLGRLEKGTSRPPRTPPRGAHNRPRPARRVPPPSDD